MRLEPVYLVSPRPKPPAMPTRRAFLLAGTTFAVGSVLGGACGYSLAASATKDTGTEDGDLAPSGDVELDELRRLAVKAPIEELVQRRMNFLNSISGDYRDDPILWKGIGRLCDQVLASPKAPDRTLNARLLAQVIERADAKWRELLSVRAEQMKGIR
jgi:hypothetical protein